MSWSYRPALDGVRTVAVYLVLLFHSGMAVAGGGFIGVDLFFVLSGFLITNVLFSDIDDCGRIRFGRFYARRVRRLLPAAVVTISVTSVVFLLVDSVVQRLPLVRDAQSALLYVANWRFLHQQNDYFATAVDKSPFLHFWSLGIEEQFYVVFPLLLVLLVRAGRRRPWVPTAGLAVLFSLSVAAQVYWAGVDANHAYYGTDARAYQLLAGSLLAGALRTWSWRPPGWVADAGAAAGLVALLVLASDLVGVGTSGRGIAAMVSATVLIAGLHLSERGRTSSLLSRPTPAYLGRISYATYLWHWPLILVLRQLVTLSAVEVAVVAGLGATGLAALSSVVLELPIRRSPVLDRFRWPTVAAGVSCCALVAVAVVPPVLSSTRRPVLLTAKPLGAGIQLSSHGSGGPHHRPRRAKVPTAMNWSALANDEGPGRTCTAADPQRCIVVRGQGLHVLLLGDSYARMLAPMMIQLAREHDFTLSLNAISSCPWQAQLVNLHEPVADQQICAAARDEWYRTVLPKLHPDVVLLASYPRDDPAVYSGTIKRIGGSSESLHDLILHTTDETLARITATGARALILRSIYTTGFDPLDCLARATYVDQCAVPVPRSRPVSDSFYNAATRQIPGVFTFDINRIVCPGRRACEPMVGGITVWRNFNHFTTQILVHFREQIWQSIERSGVLAGLADTPTPAMSQPTGR